MCDRRKWSATAAVLALILGPASANAIELMKSENAEKNVGSYVLTEQPDQTSVLKTGGSISRQNVVEARALMQFAF